MIRKIAIGIALGAFAGLVILGLAASADLLDRYELTTYDWRMRHAADPQSVNRNIVLVEINDLSIRELADPDGYRMRWPWPRVASGLVIDFLHRGGAKVIGVDFQFSERDQVEQYSFDDPKDKWSGHQSDQALADWVRESGNVVMLADTVYEGLAGSGKKDAHAANWKGSPFHAGPLAEPRPLVLAPYQELTDAAPPSVTTFSRGMTTVRRGACRRSSSARGRNCRRWAWPRRCGRRRFKPEDVAPERRAPTDRRPPHSAGQAPHRRPRSVVDADQLPGAGARSTTPPVSSSVPIRPTSSVSCLRRSRRF